ncbi:hypothetical protein KR51_00001530 [Rubidibacter lacunae KORDI 51-2]|uniref:Uncharacterized protein n=1 Tax=Rubidibacter lacunae KORDI 51-2 TaxID=582515 RepID=U5DN68_9CHRO|nr:hypothetical protein KR51_00001530 [Rubidibacter lacunae KORDI 51-2]
MVFAVTFLVESGLTRGDSLSTCITEQLSSTCRNHYGPVLCSSIVTFGFNNDNSLLLGVAQWAILSG